CCSKLGVRRGAANCSCAAAPRADSATTTDAKARTSQRAADLPVIDNLPNWSAQGLQPILRRLDPARRRLGVEFLGLGSIALRADGAPRRQDGGVVSLRQREHRKRTAGAGVALAAGRGILQSLAAGTLYRQRQYQRLLTALARCQLPLEFLGARVLLGQSLLTALAHRQLLLELLGARSLSGQSVLITLACRQLPFELLGARALSGQRVLTALACRQLPLELPDACSLVGQHIPTALVSHKSLLEIVAARALPGQ